MSQDLTDRQRLILQTIADERRCRFGEIRTRIGTTAADRTLRDDLAHLKRLNLIVSSGHGRGATWHLVDTNKADSELLKPLRPVPDFAAVERGQLDGEVANRRAFGVAGRNGEARSLLGQAVQKLIAAASADDDHPPEAASRNF